MDGFLLVDKPLNWSSFDVVAKVRGTLKRSGIAHPKVGHTGTLDPMASGLLILVIGSYTKQAAIFSKLDKTYEVVMTLGSRSTTGDREGALVAGSTKQPTVSELKKVLSQFTGSMEQTPPVYSAIKIDGQRAYKLARSGKPPIMESRPVTVYRTTLQGYNYPDVSFTTSVSSGTFIRSLVEDIGKTLETEAFTSALRRTVVGDYSVTSATSLDNLSGELLYHNVQQL
jgi:tRNA pseudouridine55 synthase